MYLVIEKMTNSWSLLYHTINGTLDEVFPIMFGPEDERNYVAGIGTASASRWETVKLDNVTIDTSNCPPEIEKPPVHYKYNEDKILDKIKDYIGRTYSSHYAYNDKVQTCLLYTSPSPRDRQKSRMPSSA